MTATIIAWVAVGFVAGQLSSLVVDALVRRRWAKRVEAAREAAEIKAIILDDGRYRCPRPQSAATARVNRWWN